MPAVADDPFGIVEMAPQLFDADERVRVPLDHEIREVRKPDRAVLRLLAVTVAQHLLVPSFVGNASGLRERAFNTASLDAVPIAELPREVGHIHEIAEPRMERLD